MQTTTETAARPLVPESTELAEEVQHLLRPVVELPRPDEQPSRSQQEQPRRAVRFDLD